MNMGNQIPNKKKEGQDLSEEAVKERRYLWMARVFALVLVVSSLTTIMLINALVSLVPIVRVQPFFLTTLNKNEQVINIVKPNLNQINIRTLTESFIRQYLLSYFSIGSNVQELERRSSIDGDVNWMSAPTVYAKFTEYADDWIKQAKEEGLTRNVQILFVQPYKTNNRENIWRAEVKFTEMKHLSQEPKESTWVVTLNVAFEQLRDLTWEQRLKNPLGFKVHQLVIKKPES
ncbi:MAG: type IV secretion system protein [Alphaproteobacteria bacterium]|nr:type IV secretion system protein [Alphaproteobacteria bacterium]